jgi:hypothetical protein
MPMSPQSTTNPDEPVRTIFLRGLPADVKEREIHNLFRLVPNYEYSTLRVGTNAQVQSPKFASRTHSATNKGPTFILHAAGRVRHIQRSSIITFRPRFTPGAFSSSHSCHSRDFLGSLSFSDLARSCFRGPAPDRIIDFIHRNSNPGSDPSFVEFPTFQHGSWILQFLRSRDALFLFLLIRSRLHAARTRVNPGIFHVSLRIGYSFRSPLSSTA